jgi:multidrug efflux pump subunit AcrA (membrane-fusion protein)
MEVVMKKYSLFIGIMVLVLSLVGCDTVLPTGEDGLVASGVVEAVEVDVAAELGGVVLSVNFAEGDGVTAGQVLVKLDSSLLEAQLEQSLAALATAEANYALVEASAALQEKQQAAAIAGAQLELTAAQQALDELYETAAMQAAQAQLTLATARDQLDDAEYRWRVQQEGYRASGDTINAAEANLILADKEVEKAQKEFNRYSGRDDDDPLRALALSNLSAARQHKDAILRQLNWYTGGPDDLEQAILDADVAFAEASVWEAERDWNTLQLGPDPDDVALLEERVATAEAQLNAAQAVQPTQEQLGVAQAQIDTAQANVSILEVQLAKSTISAPLDGVVLSRNLEPGETIAPGSTLLVIGQLDSLTITVFVPEDRYGQIQLAQIAEVTVDSFPGQVFEATVTRIADQAEFTPRNVQTEEGRRTTVFAVDLQVSDPNGQLKPGMPADVSFD